MTRRLDGLVDGSIGVFAAWTIAYEVVLIARLPRDVIWAGFAVLLVLLVVVLRRSDAPPLADEPSDRPASRESVIPLVLAGLISAGLLASSRSAVTFTVAIAAVGAGALYMRRRRVVTPSRPKDRRSMFEVGVVVLIALGFGLLTLLYRSPSGDDVYFLNRAVEVEADSGPIATRDTVFADERFPSVAPVDTVASIEPLVGATAAVTGLDVRTLYYLGFATFFAMLGVLAVWRLARTAGAISPMIVVAIAVVFVVLSSSRHGWSLPLYRPYWGKGVLVWLIVPTLWHHAVTFMRTSARRELVWLAAAAVAAVGMTSSGTFVTALVIGSAILAALLREPDGSTIRRAFRASIALAFPLLTGVLGAAVFLRSGLADVGGGDLTRLLPRVIGSGVELALVVALMLVGWLIVGSGHARIGFACAVGAALVLMSPIGTALLGSSAGVAYRAAWAIPMPLVAGLVVESPLRLRNKGIAAIALVIAGTVLVCVMASDGVVGRATRITRPSWDMDPGATRAASELIDLADGDGCGRRTDAREHARLAAERRRARGRPPTELLRMDETRRGPCVPREGACGDPGHMDGKPVPTSPSSMRWTCSMSRRCAYRRTRS